MDKAGGYREALRTILKAQELNKKVRTAQHFIRESDYLQVIIPRFNR